MKIFDILSINVSYSILTSRKYNTVAVTATYV